MVSWFLFIISLIFIHEIKCDNCTATFEVTIALWIAGNYQFDQPSTNASTWNVTLMHDVISTNNPSFFTTVDPRGRLPACILIQLPAYILDYWGLCDYLPPSSEYSNCTYNVITNNCVGPLVKTTNFNPVAELGTVEGVDVSQCGLSCDVRDRVYGLNNKQQKIVDNVKLIGLSFSIIFIVLLGFNQIMDRKELKKQKRLRVSLLSQIPYAITFWSFAIVLCLSIGTIIGDEKIVCVHNDVGNHELSFWNWQEGHSIPCSTLGFIFYSSLLSYAFNCVVLSFAIFRQFYKPMNPFFGIKIVYYHIGIYVVVIGLALTAGFVGSYGPVSPMHICVPGPSDQLTLMLYMCIPMTLSLLFAVICALGSIYFISTRIRSTKKSTDTKKMEDLLLRFTAYCIGVIVAFSLIVACVWYFWSIQPDLEKSLETTIKCEIQRYYIPSSPECKVQKRVHPFWFMAWIFSSILGTLAQLILACHNSARSRLKKMGTTINLTGSLRESSRTKSKRDASRSSKPKSSIKNSKKDLIVADGIGSDDDDHVTKMDTLNVEMEPMERNVSDSHALGTNENFAKLNSISYDTDSNIPVHSRMITPVSPNNNINNNHNNIDNSHNIINSNQNSNENSNDSNNDSNNDSSNVNNNANNININHDKRDSIQM